MKAKLIPTAATLSALLLPASANHVDFLVDGGFQITNAGGAPPTIATQTGSGGNVIGSERQIWLNSDLDNMSAELTGVPAGAGPDGPGSTFIVVSGDSADALGTFQMTYDGIGSAGLNGGAGADFDTNWNSIIVELFSVTNGGGSGGLLDLRLLAGDTNGNFGEVAIPDISSAGNYLFDFGDSGFTNAGVDFKSLNSLEFSFESTLGGTEYSIGGITREVIPEPSSSLLLGLGFLGLAARRRRQS